MRKLLIADCSEEYRTALTGVLQDTYHVLCCRTGTEAWTLLHQERPDIFVLDLMLPELDGLTLLERTGADGLHPLVLAMTPIISAYVDNCAQRLGVQYLIRKPCDIDAIASRIRDLSQRSKPTVTQTDPASYVTSTLLSLGFAAKHNGFSYLREAILQMSRNTTQSVTKELYPSVGHALGCHKDNVERSIRTALDFAWDHGDRNRWHRYFPDAVHRPSNAVFIARITEALLLEE